MYEAHFHLPQRPFLECRDLRWFFAPERIQTIVEELTLPLENGLGITFLTGPDGVGKTVMAVLAARRGVTLAPRQRHAVVLRYAAGLSVQEVADAMGCALGTAKATLNHALEHMRIEMGASDER